MKSALFVYLLTYGGAAVSLLNPYVGFLVYVAFSIICPDITFFYSVPVGNYSRTVAIAMLIGWMLHGLGNWQFGRAKPIALALLGYMLWLVIGACVAANQQEAWAFVERIFKIVLPAIVGLTLIDSLGRLKQLAWVILLSHAYVAYECNLVYLTTRFNRIYWDGWGPMDNNCVAAALVCAMGFAFFLGLYSRSWWQKGFVLGCAALLLHAVILAFSRGALVATLVSGVVSFALIPKRFSYYVIVILFLLLGFRMAGEEVRARFMTVFAPSAQRDDSAESRLQLWGQCLQTMGAHPLVGIGPGNWLRESEVKYGWQGGKMAHSFWLQTGAEQGVPALLFLFSFYALCVKRLWPIARGREAVADPWFRHFACMVIAALVGYGVSVVFVSVQGLETPYYVTILGAGVLKLCTSAQPVPSPAVKQLAASVPAQGMAAAGAT